MLFGGRINQEIKKAKFFLFINGDNPSWPVLVNQLKSYEIGVSEIGFGHNDKIIYREYGIANDNYVKDGDNVHQSYRLVKLSEIRGLIFKLYI